jgi:TonB family protein
MNPFINYLIEANLGICFFLLVYKILLNKETDHRFNRVFLLLALVISVTLPFFHFQVPSLLTIDKDLQTYLLPEIQVGTLSGPVIQFDSFWFWTSSIYLFGAATFLMLFLIRLLKIAKEIHRSPIVKNGSVWLIESNDEQEVFSFFKFIFISKSLPLSELEKKQIIRHEQVHINHLHSVDILFVNLLGILFWFNPFLKAYRKSFVQLHEFEADARSVETDEVDSYCCLLAKAALTSSGYQLANHFTNSLTLKRIEMMKTVKTKIARWKIVTLVGATISFCCLIAGNGLVSAQTKGDEVFELVDEMPSYGQGKNELNEFIGANLLYPEGARKSKIEGKVFAEFIVELDGSLSHVKIIKGIGYGCDEEVMRVVKSMPMKWKPGEKAGKTVRTKMTLPFMFRLS